MQIVWHSYGGGRDTGVRAYALLPDAITLRFSDGRTYLYTAEKPGSLHVEAMQRLAATGKGLTTYVSRHVREHYAGEVTS